jgi:hypothetical protein
MVVANESLGGGDIRYETAPPVTSDVMLVAGHFTLAKPLTLQMQTSSRSTLAANFAAAPFAVERPMTNVQKQNMNGT